MPIEVESPEEMGYDTIKYNLTESSVTDAVLTNIDLNLNQLVLCYSHHKGKPELRELIANESAELLAENVLITAGAASALFIISTSLLCKDDHLIVVRPNYATNIETPRAIGCEIDFVELQFETGFTFTLEDIASKIKPNTKLISITNPHNPTGVLIPEELLFQLAALAKERNCFLLVDETYRDLSFNNKPALAASLNDCVISVASVSKAYGLPGLRIGWLITRNQSLMNTFLAAKEQIFICNSVIDEEIAFQYLLQKDAYFSVIKKHIQTNYAILSRWIQNEPRMEMVEPGGGVVCFPRIKVDVDLVKFYEILNTKYKTFVGPGHWFEMPKNYLRIGYGWPKSEELSEGLSNISKSLDEVYKPHD